MRVAESVEENLQNACGVTSVGKQYKKCARYVAGKHLSNNMPHVSLIW
ncbi:hypothetical protein [Candidatus Nitrosotalea okcheonensis]|uniref:Uncharacterized protein n=1 Tax=Candidatus Nitrosotalea okcheonensis TaxID=1903276 RepID=A0A2H1FBZ8_9ARCH|nr:hypothetical protein [Candidatus Nitrosotalea okcheonensis]SMH70288.1 protein of unknown function [Candidatus Nitrosotalea okcheonensis]